MRFPGCILSSAVRARRPFYYEFKRVEVEETSHQEVSSFFDVESFNGLTYTFLVKKVQ